MTGQRMPRAQRRVNLVKAGRDVLFERGYGDLSMERVAERAGVSKALVYDHFANRRDLFLTILSEERARLVQRLAPALSHGDRETRVRSGVHAFLAGVEDLGEGYAELLRHPLGHDPVLAEEVQRMRDGVAEMIAGILANDIGLSVKQTLLPAYTIVGTMEAAADWIVRTPPSQRPPLAQTADLVTRLIWRGLEGAAELAESAAGAASSDPDVVRLPRRADS
jgi:AcrR family transcriptional regulator